MAQIIKYCEVSPGATNKIHTTSGIVYFTNTSEKTIEFLSNNTLPNQYKYFTISLTCNGNLIKTPYIS